jgi:hypothetical protein
MMAVDARGFPLAKRGAGELAYGMGQAAKDWATTDTGATVVGVAAGIFAGEWIGSLVTEYFNVTNGWNKILYKGIAKAALSFGLFYLGRRTGGMVKILLNGASAGALASIIGDVVGEYVAPGLVGKGNSAGLTGITIKANNSGKLPGATSIGAKSQVITAV